MARLHRYQLRAAIVAAGMLAAASAGHAQPPKPTAATSDDHAEAEDRIFALVQAGKCGQAKAAAERANDTNLAEQIGTMCGLKAGPTSSSSGGGGGQRGGGGGGQGGGMGAGRRGGG